MFFEIVSFIFTGLFAGVALYISFVEQHGRLASEPAVALAEWRFSYRRAAILQIVLVTVGVLSAIAAYYLGRGVSVFVAGMLLASADDPHGQGLPHRHDRREPPQRQALTCF